MDDGFGDEEPKPEPKKIGDKFAKQNKIVFVQAESEIGRWDGIGVMTPIFGRFGSQIVFEMVVSHQRPRHHQRQVINIVEEIDGEDEEGLRTTGRI